MTNQTVREIAVAIPASVRVFEKYKIDFCCNGKRPLETACQEAGVSAAALLDEIEAAGRADAAPGRDWARAGLAELSHHIVGKHHKYLYDELPVIAARMDKVIAKHAADKPWLNELGKVYAGLHQELDSHLQKEETILFPYIQQLEQGRTGASCFGSISNPIRMMLFEHDNAGAALARMRDLSSDYQPPEDACPTFRALLHELSVLEADLHQHIHLENNILFPRAIALEEERTAAR